MNTERLRITDTRHVIDRLSHARQVALTPDATSLCAAAALTAFFGADAYIPSRLFTEQSLSANEQAIVEAVEVIGAWFYEPRTTHNTIDLLNHPYTLGALAIQTIYEPKKQPKSIPHVIAIIPSECKTDDGSPRTYYLVDTKNHQPILPLDFDHMVKAITEVESCFVITRSPIPQTLQEQELR